MEWWIGGILGIKSGIFDVRINPFTLASRFVMKNDCGRDDAL